MSNAHERSRLTDLRILWHLLFRPVHGRSHAERMESFYGGQASGYDDFRANMLHGRRDLIAEISFPQGGVWVDLGAGTGANLAFAGASARQLNQIHLVDLSPSLLTLASDRAKQMQLANVTTHLADATEFDLADRCADVVTFSYSLTMIPDWFEAISVAERLLKPGGMIAAVDFYVSRKYAQPEHHQHRWLTRAFWTHWFASDNVFLGGDQVAMLHRRFKKERFEERSGKLPYLPLLRVPYYVFTGRKENSDAVH